MGQFLLSPEEQVRQVVATLAIENLYPSEEMIKTGLEIAKGTVDVEDAIEEIKRKYDRS